MTVFNQMMMPGGADEECYRQFLMLLEDTVCHEVKHVSLAVCNYK